MLAVALAAACSSSSKTSTPATVHDRTADRRTTAAELPARRHAAPQPDPGARIAQQLPRAAVPAGARGARQVDARAGAASLDYAHRPLAAAVPARRAPARARRVVGPDGREVREAVAPEVAATSRSPIQPGDGQARASRSSTRPTSTRTPRASRSCCACRPVKTWSDANPGHVPIMIDVEMKDDDGHARDVRRARRGDPFGASTPDDLITPDVVRGNDPSLGDAVRTHGWPTLGAVRGRVMFMLDNEGFGAVELAGAPVAARPHPLHVVAARRRTTPRSRKLNDPIADAAKIKAALAAQHARAHPRRRRHRAGPRRTTRRCATPRSPAARSS